MSLLLRNAKKTFKIISIGRFSSYNISNISIRKSSNKISNKELKFYFKNFKDAEKRTDEIYAFIDSSKNTITQNKAFKNRAISKAINLIPIIGLAALGYYFMYHIIDRLDFTENKMNNKNFDEIEPKINDQIEIQNEIKIIEGFSSVFGNEEAKEQLEDIVQFLKHSERFSEVNARMPKGILLTGEPGCGKTLMARALAEEANVTYIHAAGSSFDEMFVGMGAKRVRKLFKRAREKAPCIIFIDELDSIGEKRSSFSGSTSRMTLNQILSEIDGFKNTEKIIVVAATNMPKRLDPALTRSGRFDRIIEVQLPDKKTRKEMLIHFLKDKPLIENLDLELIAGQTIGMSGADLKNIANIAAIEASKKRQSFITLPVLLEAVTRLSLGKVRSSIHLSERVVFNTAIHEAGHTVSALFTKEAPPVSQLTVLPRGESLGSTWLIPFEESQYSMTSRQIEAMIDVAMGGHAAEEIFFGKSGVTTGASSDFANATKMAISMVAQYGMSEKFGKMSVDLVEFANWSPLVKEIVLNEAKNILERAYERTLKLLEEKRDVLTDLVDEVVRDETLSKERVYSIAGLK